MKPNCHGSKKPTDQQGKYRSDSEVPIAVSEEEVKLSEVVTQSNRAETAQQPPPAIGWIARVCSCFPPTSRRRRNERKGNGPLLPPQLPHYFGKPTLVLDLDETLVHASFTPGTAGDLVFQLEIDGRTYLISVLFRPGAQLFLLAVSRVYEVVIFTASLSVYADRVIDVLDVKGVVSGRLFRDSCTYLDGSYVKDLDQLGRDLRRVVILDVFSR